MKKIFLIFLVFSLLLVHVFQASGQAVPNVFDTSNFPQWAKDLRRVDIITFGAFPFSMFFVTTVMDSIRWSQNADFSFSEEGRRYAPWPLKSKGPEPMTTDEQFRTIMIAAGVSVTIALVDLLIVKIRQDKERRRIESMQTSTYNIEKTSVNPQITDESGNNANSGEENSDTGGKAVNGVE